MAEIVTRQGRRLDPANEDVKKKKSADFLRDVRLAGGWTRYFLRPHKSLLVLRGLCHRGRATYDNRTPEVLVRLFGAPDARRRTRSARAREGARVHLPDPLFWRVLEFALGDRAPTTRWVRQRVKWRARPPKKSAAAVAAAPSLPWSQVLKRPLHPLVNAPGFFCARASARAAARRSAPSDATSSKPPARLLNLDPSRRGALSHASRCATLPRATRPGSLARLSSSARKSVTSSLLITEPSAACAGRASPPACNKRRPTRWQHQPGRPPCGSSVVSLSRGPPFFSDGRRAVPKLEN